MTWKDYGTESLVVIKQTETECLHKKPLWTENATLPNEFPENVTRGRRYKELSCFRPSLTTDGC